MSSSDWVVVLIIQLIFCFSAVEDTSASKILQKIEGNVMVQNAESTDWMPETRVCLEGGEYCGYLKRSGDFVIHNVPPGSYVVEVLSPNYVFDPVRVNISSKNGKIKAQKIDLFKTEAISYVNYPLQFRTEKQADFFEKKERQWGLDTLKDPMVCHAVILPHDSDLDALYSLWLLYNVCSWIFMSLLLDFVKLNSLTCNNERCRHTLVSSLSCYWCARSSRVSQV